MLRRTGRWLVVLAVAAGLLGLGGCRILSDAGGAEEAVFFGELDLASANVIVEPGWDGAGGLEGLYVISTRDLEGVLPDRQAFLTYDDGPTAWSSFWYTTYGEFNCEATIAVRRAGSIDLDDPDLLSESDRERVLDRSARLASVSVECRDSGLNPPQVPIPPHWACEEQPDGFTHCTDPTDAGCEANVYVIHPDGQTLDYPEGCVGSGL